MMSLLIIFCTTLLWITSAHGYHVPLLQFLSLNLSSELNIFDGCDNVVASGDITFFRSAVLASLRSYGTCYGDDRNGTDAAAQSCIEDPGSPPATSISLRTCTINSFLSTYDRICSDQLLAVDRCNNVSSVTEKGPQAAPSTKNISTDLVPFCPENWFTESHPASDRALTCMSKTFDNYFGCLAGNSSNRYCRTNFWPFAGDGSQWNGSDGSLGNSTSFRKNPAPVVYVAAGIPIGLVVSLFLICYYTKKGKAQIAENQQLGNDKDGLIIERDDARKELVAVTIDRDRTIVERENVRGERDGAWEERENMKKERNRVREERDNVRKERDRAWQERENMRGEKNKVREERDNLISKIAEAIAERDLRRSERDTARAERENMRRERNRVREERDNLISKIAEATAERDIRRSERDTARAERENMRRERNRVQEERDNLVRKIVEVVAERDNVRRERDRAREERDAATEERNTARRERNDFQTQLRRTTETLGQVRVQVDGLRTQVDKFNQEKTTLEEENDELRRNLEILEKQNEEYGTTIAGLEAKKERLHDKVMELRGDLAKYRKK